MRNVKNDQNRFIEVVTNIVENILNNKNLSLGEWQHGKVIDVLSNKLLLVSINGSKHYQKVPCNPDVTFNIGDEVYVQYVNRNSKDKFIPYKRGV